MNYQQYLDELQTKVAELNQLCDNAAHTIKKVEESLALLSTGITASVTAANGNRLVYGRIGGHFRIGVMFAEETKPWSDCPREVKLNTFNRLEALLAEISKQVDLKIVIAKGLRDPDPITHEEASNGQIPGTVLHH